MDKDNTRCAICGWPLGNCQPGNCSQRPFPARYYDAERAKREYAPHSVNPVPSDKDLQSDIDNLRGSIKKLHSLTSEQLGVTKFDLAALGYGALVTLDRIIARIPEVTPSIKELSDMNKAQRAVISDLNDVLGDYLRLTKELDVALNGDDAATNPSLCDIVAQVRNPKPETSLKEDCIFKNCEFYNEAAEGHCNGECCGGSAQERCEWYKYLQRDRGIRGK